MRAVVQRVSSALVAVAKQEIAAIGNGLLVYLGVGKNDSLQDAEYLADKILNLRLFESDNGDIDLSLRDSGGELLVVSQFTLYGDCRKGRRPSFSNAAAPERALELYEYFIEVVKREEIVVRNGQFRAMMAVESQNRGPVTLLLDSKREF